MLERNTELSARRSIALRHTFSSRAPISHFQAYSPPIVGRHIDTTVQRQILRILGWGSLENMLARQQPPRGFPGRSGLNHIACTRSVAPGRCRPMLTSLSRAWSDIRVKQRADSHGAGQYAVLSLVDLTWVGGCSAGTGVSGRGASALSPLPKGRRTAQRP
jgi:hypothetical protein